MPTFEFVESNSISKSLIVEQNRPQGAGYGENIVFDDIPPNPTVTLRTTDKSPMSEEEVDEQMDQLDTRNGEFDFVTPENIFHGIPTEVDAKRLKGTTKFDVTVKVLLTE